MGKKYLIMFSVLFVFILGIVIYKWQTTDNQGNFQHILQQISANDYLPYKGSGTVKISIIDTGVQLTNEFLDKENLSQFYLDEYSKVSKQYHGTMVAGILLANGDKSTEPKGLLPKGEVISIQSGTDMGMTSKQLAEAIDLSVNKGAKIINISLGTTKYTELLKKSVHSALSKGVVIVASDGNDSKKTYYPAAFDNVISVGAITKEKTALNVSDIDEVDIFAPGESILTTVAYKDKSKGSFTGNSAATPIVTSVVAFLLSEYPEIEPQEVESILTNNADLLDYKDKTMKVVNLKNIVTNLPGNKQH